MMKYFNTPNRPFFPLFLSWFLLFSISCTDKKKEASYPSPFIEEISLSIHKSPTDGALYAQRGLAYSELELYDEAILDLQESIELAPNNPNPYNWLSDIYYDNDDIDNALFLLEQGIRKFPKQEKFYLKGAEVALINELPQKAAVILDLYKTKFGTTIDSDYLYGKLLVQKQDTANASILFEKIITNSEAFPIEAHLEIGKIQVAQNNYPNSLDSVLKHEPNHIEALFLFAEYNSDQNQLLEAKKRYKKILLLNHNSTTALYNIGLLELEQNNTSEAIKNFQLVTKLDPSYIRAYYFLGIALEKKGLKDQAILAYEHLLKIDPNFAEAQQAIKALK